MTEREALQELVAAIKDSPLVSHFDGEQRLSDAYNAGVAIIAAPPAPEPVIPAYRGYAALGTGQYVINHSAAGYPAELVITLATEADKAGRQIGESRDNQPDAPLIQADEMVIRIAFTSERGLFALEDQLAWIRRVHFPCPPAPEPPAAPVDDLGDDAAMIAFRAQYPSASRAKHVELWTPFLIGWQECAVAARAVLAALRAERDQMRAELTEAEIRRDNAEASNEWACRKLAAIDDWPDGRALEFYVEAVRTLIKTEYRGAIYEAEAEQLTRPYRFRAERAEAQLAAAQAVLAAAHDALTEIALAGMSLPMVCGDDEETKNRFHARRAWEFIGIAARAKTEIDAARAAAGGGK